MFPIVSYPEIPPNNEKAIELAKLTPKLTERWKDLPEFFRWQLHTAHKEAIEAAIGK